MSKFLNPKYESLKVYTPGEQPQDKKYIKLNTNESPYPPSEKVLQTVNREVVSSLNLYPDNEAVALKDSIAQLYGVKRENVFVSNGSDDILNFAFMAFCGEGCEAVFPDITYGFYTVFADLHKVKYTQIPLKEDFTIDIEQYKNTGKTIFIANPNAPTGLTLTLSQIEEILNANPDNVVVIDEAYVDFGAESCTALTDKYKNLLVVQTFSKSRSLAGARLGFAIADRELIEDLDRIKYSTNPYSINRMTMQAGVASIESNDYYIKNCEEIIKTRQYTTDELKKLGFTCTDSLANFIFAKKEGVSGEYIYQSLKEKGVLIRHFTGERICDYNRITVGKREEMDALLTALKEII